MKGKIFFAFLFLISFFTVFAQTSGTESESLHFDMTGFPQWSKDLRRGEIIAFGSFPFAFFFTNFTYDSYRWAVNGRDVRYAPWPFKPAGAIELTQDEQFMTLGIAAGIAVTAAIVDHVIVRIKRSKQNNGNNVKTEEPVIIRRPLNEVIDSDFETEEYFSDNYFE